jgi:hypothetical protein
MTLIIQKPTGAKLNLAKTYVGTDDPDAAAYITAVEAADTAAGQSGGLETATKVAIHSFVKGCKADGIWPAIKASCILAGARTLTGALVPLTGAAPTNFNFVSGDYNRKTGLVGDGSTKYLNSNRNNDADPQNSNHNAVWLHTIGITEKAYMGLAVEGGNWNLIYNQIQDRLFARNRSSSGVGGTASGPLIAPFSIAGCSRSGNTTVNLRAGGANVAFTSYSSGLPASSNLLIYRRGLGNYTDARIAFYSIGESLDLALLDARVTDLINAFGVAIP